MNRHLQYEESYINTQNSSQNSVLSSQSIYYMLLRDSANLLSINKFRVSKASKPLYPDTVKHPDFFNYNLVSPGRVIKILEGPKAVLRGFYYQLMKLAFQIQIQNKDYIEILKHVVFNPQLMIQQDAQSPSSGKSYSDAQYKKIIAEFINILLNQNIPNFQLTIIQYPIVDEALIKIMQNLLILKYGQGYRLTNKQILETLSQFFQVNVVQYGSCFKFQESDIFLYEKSQNQLYIAFLNEMAEMSQTSSSKQVSSSNKILSNNKISQQSGDNSDYDFSQNNKNIYHNQNHAVYNDKNQNSHSELMQTPNRNQNRQYSSHLTKEFQINQQQKKGYRNTYGGRESNNNNKLYNNNKSSSQAYGQSSSEKQKGFFYQQPLPQSDLKKRISQQQVKGYTNSLQHSNNLNNSNKKEDQKLQNNLTAIQKQQYLRPDFDAGSYGSSSLINNLNSLMNTKSSRLQNQTFQYQYQYQAQKSVNNNNHNPNQNSNLNNNSNKYVYKSPFSNFQSSGDNNNNQFQKFQTSKYVNGNSKNINIAHQHQHQYNNNSSSIHSNTNEIKYVVNSNHNQAKYDYSFNINNYSYLKNKQGSQGTVVRSPSSFDSNIGSISQGKSSLINKSKPNINLDNVPMINSITTNPYINSSAKTNPIYQIQSLRSNNGFIKSSNSVNQSSSNNFIKKPELKQQSYKVVVEQKPKLKKQINNFIEKQKQESLFHRPQKKTRFNLNNLNEVFQLQPSPSSKQIIVQDNSIGTLYRQFTDTKVLKILPQVMQDNIRRMRKKFRGKHTKTFTGFF